MNHFILLLGKVNQKESFIKTIQEHRGLIYKAATLYTSNKEDREDLVQEIIYQLWKSYDSFQEKSSRSTWMYRVAMNVAIQHFKQSKKGLSVIPLNRELLNIQEEDNTEWEERWEKLQAQIKTLNLLEKGILMLYLENKSYREIAQIIGMSATNVGTKLARIKTKLKNNMSK